VSSLLTWTDVFDILIVTLIFYGIYLSIRGTRAVPLLMGVGLIAVFGALADWFRLRTVDFLFSNMFWSVGLIFLIVVFQPEIRSSLANLGQRRIWSFFTELKSESLINALVNTCETLKKREIGALIALEREVGLKSYINTGTEINSTVTPELLLTIFMSKGPLHDGGVVIQENSVTAAGCIFPLSDRSDIDASFGTRHRAALGLGEETDAVVLVVSEETGSITFVHGSRYEADLDLQTLEDRLYELLAE